MIYRILRHGEQPLTVFSEKNLPQYLIYEKNEDNVETIKPMTEEDKGDPIESPNFFTLIKNIIVNIVKIIIEQLGKLIKK